MLTCLFSLFSLPLTSLLCCVAAAFLQCSHLGRFTELPSLFFMSDQKTKVSLFPRWRMYFSALSVCLSVGLSARAPWTYTCAHRRASAHKAICSRSSSLGAQPPSVPSAQLSLGYTPNFTPVATFFFYSTAALQTPLSFPPSRLSRASLKRANTCTQCSFTRSATVAVWLAHKHSRVCIDAKIDASQKQQTKQS